MKILTVKCRGLQNVMHVTFTNPDNEQNKKSYLPLKWKEKITLFLQKCLEKKVYGRVAQVE